MAANSFPLRLSKSILKAALEAAAEDGVSLNQFVSTAVAKKLSALKTSDILQARAARADRAAFDRVMARSGRVMLREGDFPDKTE